MLYILLIIAIFIDGYLSVIIPTNSIFLPLLTLTTLYLIYPYFKKHQTKYKVITILAGILYDSLYTNLLLFHTIVFLILTEELKFIYKNLIQTKLQRIIYLILVIVSYEILVALFLFMFQVTTITINKVITKIIGSLCLNIIYAIIVIPLLKYSHN